MLLMVICLPGHASPSQEEMDTRNLLDEFKNTSLRLENPIDFNEYSVCYNNLYIKIRKFEISYPNSRIGFEIGTAFTPYRDAYGIWKRPFPHQDKYKWAFFLRPKEIEYLQGQYPGIQESIQSNQIATLDNGNLIIGSTDNFNSFLEFIFTVADERIKILENQINLIYQTAQ